MVLMNLVHMAGDTAILECPLSGLDLEPGYVVTWQRDVGELPSNRLNFTCDNETLVLRDVRSSEDIDAYTCRVTEPSGRIFEFTRFLQIFGK